MTDHDAPTPEVDDEIRARLQAFADAVAERADTEKALERMPRRSRPPTLLSVAIAACVLAVVALAAVAGVDRQEVDTSAPSQSPTQTTDCPSTSTQEATTMGGQMNRKLAVPVASAATAIMLLSACGDDDGGPTTLAKGEDVDIVGEDGIGSQTLTITAEEENGEVTGEIQFNDEVLTLECANTDVEDMVILGGEITAPETSDLLGTLNSLIIREGDPDSVALLGNDVGAESCAELVESVPDDAGVADGSVFADLEDGENIETG